MAPTSVTTPVSPDRVLAGALRMTLLPVLAPERAVDELVQLAGGQAPALAGALERLHRDRGTGPASVAATATERLLRDALDADTVAFPAPQLAQLAS
jgi:hypothetical protein